MSVRPALRSDIDAVVATIFAEHEKDPARFEQEAQTKGVSVDQVLVDTIRFGLAQLTWTWGEAE